MVVGSHPFCESADTMLPDNANIVHQQFFLKLTRSPNRTNDIVLVVCSVRGVTRQHMHEAGFRQMSLPCRLLPTFLPPTISDGVSMLARSYGLYWFG